MLYLAILCNNSAILSISWRVSFPVAAKYAIAKNFNQPIRCTLYSNVQGESEQLTAVGEPFQFGKSSLRCYFSYDVLRVEINELPRVLLNGAPM